MGETEIYDIVVIGAGPAGLTAAYYAGRANYKTIILEKFSPGGQMILTTDIDNYPAFPEPVSGFELQEKMTAQVKKFNVKIKTEEVQEIEKKDNFIIKTASGNYTAYSVIIATGARHRNLGIPGEKEFSSKGVSYCGTCDGPFYRGKQVYVIGGGDTALTEAIFIAKFAKSVKIVHRKDRFRAVASLTNRIKNIDNIECIFNTVATEIKGENLVNSIVLKNIKTNQIQEEKTDGVFIFIGLIPNTDFVADEVLDSSKYIITNHKMETSINGLFAAGDIRSETFRQIVCAASDGAKAAQFAGEYVDELKGVAYK